MEETIINRRILGSALLAIAVVLAVLLPPPQPVSAGGAALPHLLLSLDGVPGGFHGSGHDGAIVIDSYAAGESPGEGSLAFGDIALTKRLDASSLPLLKALIGGKEIKEGTLFFQNDSPDATATYMAIHLTGIHVTGYSLSASSGTLPAENIQLHADGMRFAFTTLNPSGAPNGSSIEALGPVSDSHVSTRYHFEPIEDKTASGKPYIKGFHVSLQASAANSRVTGIHYRINGGAWLPYTGPFDIDAADTHVVEYFGTDQAGDTEAANRMDFDLGHFSGAGAY